MAATGATPEEGVIEGTRLVDFDRNFGKVDVRWSDRMFNPIVY